MSAAKEIVSYWLSCIEQEDVLSQSFLQNSRGKFKLNPFTEDIFLTKNNRVVRIDDNDEDLLRFVRRAITSNIEFYYGYPLIRKKNKDSKWEFLPVFLLPAQFGYDAENQAILSVDIASLEIGLETAGLFGINASEIPESINRLIPLFLDDELTGAEKVLRAVSLIKGDSELPFDSEIDPDSLDDTPSKGTAASLLNKSILFESTSSVFNRALLQDLRQLCEKHDFKGTGLDTIFRQSSDLDGRSSSEMFPLLPFATDEYQLYALRKALNNPKTIITGPPGTGKSQFIMNLILNFAVQNKSVLFVSHTNEAVRTVEEKIKEMFGAVILRTGNYGLRKDLPQALDLLLETVNGFSSKVVHDNSRVQKVIDEISRHQQLLVDLDSLHERLFSEKERYNNSTAYFKDTEAIHRVIDGVYQQYEIFTSSWKTLSEVVRRQSESGGSLFARIGNWFRVRHCQRLFSSIMDLDPGLSQLLKGTSPDTNPELVMIPLQQISICLDDWHACRKTETELSVLTDKPRLEKRIEKLFEEYRELSENEIRAQLLKNHTKQKSTMVLAKRYSRSIASRLVPDDSHISLSDMKSIVPMWACTLKSLHDNFQLRAGMFDVVIFDESSQIDLPSAAPALYRAKQVIIVGDPKQLSHITSITDTKDKQIALRTLGTSHPLYPDIIGYKAKNLFSAAESMSSDLPIFLSNHYRSSFEIIELCNALFYNQRLSIASRYRENWPINLERGIQWIDCRGTLKSTGTGYGRKSKYNDLERKEIVKLLQTILNKIHGQHISIGIVSPYSAQVKNIETAVHDSIPGSLIAFHEIKIKTAHQFQGDEKDIMIFSPVLSGKGAYPGCDAWFNLSPEVLNVALSRARMLLYIVGDYPFCRSRKGVLQDITVEYGRLKDKQKKSLHAESLRFESPFEERLYNLISDSGLLTDTDYVLVSQFPEGQYYLDLALVGPVKVNIECDGGQHLKTLDGTPVLKDIRRDAYLRSRNWKVLRFRNHEILYEPERVLKTIRNEMRVPSYVKERA